MSRTRRESILRRLQTGGFVSTQELVHDLDVHAATIRRDLQRLDDIGLVERTHGGARAVRADLKVEPLQHQGREPQKRAIAACVASQIDHGESVAIDSGTTAVAVALALLAHHDLTVVTNDLKVALTLADKADCRVLMTGGEVAPHIYSVAGERGLDMIRQLHVDIAVIGADAFDAEVATNTSNFAVSMKRALLASARRKILAVDSSKFGQRALVRIAPMQEFSLVVTDDGLPPVDRVAITTDVLAARVG